MSNVYGLVLQLLVVRAHKEVGSSESGLKRSRARRTAFHVPEEFTIDTLLAEICFPGTSSWYAGPPTAIGGASVSTEKVPQRCPALGGENTLKWT